MGLSILIFFSDSYCVNSLVMLSSSILNKVCPKKYILSEIIQKSFLNTYENHLLWFIAVIICSIIFKFNLNGLTFFTSVIIEIRKNELQKV